MPHTTVGSSLNASIAGISMLESYPASLQNVVGFTPPVKLECCHMTFTVLVHVKPNPKKQQNSLEKLKQLRLLKDFI
jgi:hypothetical protein